MAEDNLVKLASRLPFFEAWVPWLKANYGASGRRAAEITQEYLDHVLACSNRLEYRWRCDPPHQHCPQGRRLWDEARRKLRWAGVPE